MMATVSNTAVLVSVGLLAGIAASCWRRRADSGAAGDLAAA